MEEGLLSGFKNSKKALDFLVLFQLHKRIHKLTEHVKQWTISNNKTWNNETNLISQIKNNFLLPYARKKKFHTTACM